MQFIREVTEEIVQFLQDSGNSISKFVTEYAFLHAQKTVKIVIFYLII